MKKALLVIVIAAFGLKANAQTGGSQIGAFMNAALPAVVDSSAQYYYVYEQGDNPNFVAADTVQLRNLSEVPYHDFLEAIQNDPAPVKWRDYQLPKARLANSAHMPKNSNTATIFKYVFPRTTAAEIKQYYDQNIIPVPMGTNMTQDKLDYAFEKAKAAYEARPHEEKCRYWLSKPIFSKDKNYALFGVRSADESGLFIFKHTDGKWIKLMEFKAVSYN